MPKDRYLRAAEFKTAYPLGKKVVHHGHVTLAGEDGCRTVPLARYGVGKTWEIFPEGTALLIPAQGTIEWNLHYAPISLSAKQSLRTWLMLACGFIQKDINLN